MIEIVIRQPNLKDAVARLPNGAYVVGSAKGCHIPVNRPEVSGRHAQLVVRENTLNIMDLGSSNGTYLDGNLLFAHEPYPVGPKSVIGIGKATITVRSGASAPAPAPAPESKKTPAATPGAGAESVGDFSSGTSSSGASKRFVSAREAKQPTYERFADQFGKEAIPILKVSGVEPEARAVLQELKKHAHRELLKQLNLKKLAVSGASASELEKKAAETIRDILSRLTVSLPDGVSLGVLERELLQESIGLGPLEYLLGIDEITEIMVNGPEHVYAEKGGVLYRTDTAFADDNQVLSAIERIVAPLGRRIDESSPMVDARLPDGSRVNAIIPPLSLVGPSITIRKFAKKPYGVDDLIRFGSVSPEIMKFLEICVKVRKNILISGGTGSGKTTLLNVLSSFLPNRERIVTIEDAAELQLMQEHLVRLEARPPNVEGRGEITIRDLVRNSLRMRPDRIVVGECRGGEALDMLQAMNTGHDGSLTTIHANSARDALARLETLVLMAGFDLPLRAIREQVASAINIIVQISRERDGSRKIVSVSEITKMEGDVITMQDLFVFRQTGWDENNRIAGEYVPTGGVPTFLDDIERAKLPLDIGMFRPKERDASRNFGEVEHV